MARHWHIARCTVKAKFLVFALFLGVRYEVFGRVDVVLLSNQVMPNVVRFEFSLTSQLLFSLDVSRLNSFFVIGGIVFCGVLC